MLNCNFASARNPTAIMAIQRQPLRPCPGPTSLTPQPMPAIGAARPPIYLKPFGKSLLRLHSHTVLPRPFTASMSPTSIWHLTMIPIRTLWTSYGIISERFIRLESRTRYAGVVTQPPRAKQRTLIRQKPQCVLSMLQRTCSDVSPLG